MIEQLELEVKELLERAEQAEAKEAQETLDIPAELARREKRVAALKQARQSLSSGQRDGRSAAGGVQSQTGPAASPARGRQKPRGPEPTPPSELPIPRRSITLPIRKVGS